MNNYKYTVESIRSQLSNYIQEKKLKSLVLGISGGIDSALVVALAKPVCDDLNIPLIGRYISISSNKPDERERARLIGKSLCTTFDEVDMTNEYEVLSDSLYIGDETMDIDYKIRQGNIKARLRMINLYNLASYNKGLVLSTDNYTEFLLGFWTIAGDIGDYGMIQELWKTEVYEISEWLCENEYKIDAPHSMYDKRGVALINCINATATDGLGITNSDLDQILPGFVGTSKGGYAEVDKILSVYLEIGSDNIDHPVIQRHIKTDFKRNWPITIKRNKIIK